ncbi:hypothetical protein ACF07Y_36520 [Streptomyces sp. NPDC016566]|uniref:hypothetical protein n=1 Tax=Streptomyces sp. NPDC016566 TaxID=3364967 RepID=UPI0036FAE881
MQEYILSAAYTRATAVEQTFLRAFEASMARSGAAFASASSGIGNSRAEQHGEQQARQEL